MWAEHIKSYNGNTIVSIILHNGRLLFNQFHECQKEPNLHTSELNTTLFCSTSPLKAPNGLKSLKLAWRFVLTFIKIRSHRRKFSNSDSVEQKFLFINKMIFLNKNSIFFIWRKKFYSDVIYFCCRTSNRIMKTIFMFFFYSATVIYYGGQ
jgi:hypothetical protein